MASNVQKKIYHAATIRFNFKEWASAGRSSACDAIVAVPWIEPLKWFNIPLFSVSGFDEDLVAVVVELVVAGEGCHTTTNRRNRAIVINKCSERSIAVLFPAIF